MDLNGNKVEGDLNPSSDTKTHLELYPAGFLPILLLLYRLEKVV